MWWIYVFKLLFAQDTIENREAHQEDISAPLFFSADFGLP